MYPATEIAGIYALLLEKYLGMRRVDAALRAQEVLLDEQLRLLEAALERLLKHEPIQYILGETTFFDLTLEVSPATLIPRPETEELVAWILSDCEERKTENLHAVDIGTGSGCIALALKNNLPKLEITAMDISKDALEIVARNANQLNLSIETLQIDVLKDSLPKNSLDFIVSNPPYVGEIEKKEMRDNVLKYEPELALFVKDSNPLLFYDRILDVATESVKKEGSVYFEINERFAVDIIKIAKEKGWRNNRVKKDIFGRDRMLRCRR